MLALFGLLLLPLAAVDAALEPEQVDIVKDVMRKFVYPTGRFVAFSDLSSPLQSDVTTILGYDSAEAWNEPSSNKLETKSYGRFSEEEIAVLAFIGFKDQYSFDCWSAHFYSYGWSELEEVGVQQYYAALGWTENM
jgi:uncharacterized heparinase superfamily protein